MRNAIALAALLLTVATGSFWWGRQSPASRKNPPLPISADAVPGPGEPLYWYDPMRPDQHFDKPGKSPDRKSTRLNSSHPRLSRMPSSA